MAARLVAFHLTPNIITVAGLLVCAASATLIGLGYLLPGGIVLFFASIFDMLDGALAHVTGTTHRYGAFLDSTVDRYAEAFTYIGLLVYYLLRQHAVLEPMLIIVALTGSMLVSYVRARAQSLGFTVDAGLLARPERVVITVTGLIITPVLIWALWILAVLTNITALQRIWIVWRQSRRSPEPGELPRGGPAASGTPPPLLDTSRSAERW